MNFQQVHLRIDQKTYQKISSLADGKNQSISETIRQIIAEGLKTIGMEEVSDEIAEIVRQQMEIVIKPHVERLASLSAKSGIASATSMFLNTQALMDLVPVERKKDVRTMYDKARVKAVYYMKTKTEDLENLETEE